MSFQSFATLFEDSGIRLTEMKRLTDLADGNIGIVDDDTDCDKAYWEHVGPSENTGTHTAAIIDLYRVLRAREESSIIKLGYIDGTDSHMVINDTGVGVGIAPSVSYDLNVGTGGLSVSGSLVALGTSAFSGNMVLSGSLTMATSKYLNAGSFDLRLSEEIHTGTLGQIFSVFSIDPVDGSLVYRNRYNDVTKWEVQAGGLVGDIRIDDYDGDPCFAFDTQSSNPHLNIYDQDSTFTKSDIPSTNGPSLNIFGQSTAEVHLIAETDAFSQSALIFTVAPDTANEARWRLVHDHTASTDELTFGRWTSGSTYDKVLRMSDNLVHVLSSSGNDTKFLITSGSSETVEFFEFTPNLIAHANRKEGAADTFGGAIRIGWQDTYVGVLRQDSYSAWSSLRLYYDTFSIGSAEPNIAIGKPLGTYTAPIDCLNVMDTPFMVAVNADHRWLNVNHPTKEGLWIGRGDASSTYKAARICLQDQSGERSAIQWGISEEIFSQFIKDGVSRLTTTVDSNDFGSTVFGFTAIPTFETTGVLSSGQVAIELELQANVTEINPGAMVLIEDSANARELWIVTPDGLNWARFAADSVVAVS
jgi:hypothetical protein